MKQGSCPNKILHNDFKAGPKGTFFVPHNQIAQDGIACTGNGALGIVTKEALEAVGGLEALLATKEIAPVVQELKKQGSSFLVGSEPTKRICGDSSISANSIFLFVEETKQIEVPGLINLFPGAKYMIIYEKNSPVPCTYFSKSSKRAIGESAPSPKPNSVKPAPGIVATPAVGSGSGDGSDNDTSSVSGNSAKGTSGKGSGSDSDSRPGSGDDDDSADGNAATDEADDAEDDDEPEESPGDGDGASACFPADASVTLEGGYVKRMDDLQIGDRVQVSPNAFSDVFMFTHRDAKSTVKFIELSTVSGLRIYLTPGHYMYANGRLAAASTVREGDIVDLANGEESRVTTLRTVAKKGVYNPQTLHGDIAVNGVLASTYTIAVDPRAAHSLLTPLRALFRAIGASTGTLESGSRTLASVSPKGSSLF